MTSRVNTRLSKSLRDRCKDMLQRMQANAILRQNDPVEYLMAFVKAEKGRDASPELDDCKSLVLYFKTPQEREEFIEMWQQAKPGTRTLKLP